jgi:hypothetical protein
MSALKFALGTRSERNRSARKEGPGQLPVQHPGPFQLLKLMGLRPGKGAAAQRASGGGLELPPAGALNGDRHWQRHRQRHRSRSRSRSPPPRQPQQQQQPPQQQQQQQQQQVQDGAV